MNILLWLAFGILIGVITNATSSKPSFDNLIGTTILGVLGSLLGGFLGNLIFKGVATEFTFSSLIIAALGSLVLLLIDSSFSKRS